MVKLKPMKIPKIQRNLIIGIVFILFFISGTALWLAAKNRNSGKLRICPDSWIDNQMPTIKNLDYKQTISNQYFILNEKRRELSEFDLDWVKKNCNVEPQIVD